MCINDLFLLIYLTNNKLYQPPLASPSSPLRAVPTKYTLPSSATISACRPSWPRAMWTIFGDFVMVSSAHLPWAWPDCLIPREAALPWYRTCISIIQNAKKTFQCKTLKKKSLKCSHLQAIRRRQQLSVASKTPENVWIWPFRNCPFL